MFSQAVAEVQYPWRKLRLQMALPPSHVRTVLDFLDIKIIVLFHICIYTEFNFIYLFLRKEKKQKGEASSDDDAKAPR